MNPRNHPDDLPWILSRAESAFIYMKDVSRLLERLAEREEEIKRLTRENAQLYAQYLHLTRDAGKRDADKKKESL